MKPSFDSSTGRQAIWQKMDAEMRELIDPATGNVREELACEVNCPVCGGTERKVLFKKMGFSICRCVNCDTVHVNPQLKPETTLTYYRQDDASQKERSSSSMWIDVLCNPENQRWQRPYFQEAVDILRHQIPAKGARLLDLGCSIGLFMEVAQQNDFEVVGLELETEACEYARSAGLNVTAQTLAEADYPDNSFDVITLFGVLEHLQHPDEVLKDVVRCLKPGGALMAIVPNVASLAASVLHENSRMFNGRNHLTYFSWKTLATIVERFGLQVSHLDTVLTGLDSVLNHLQFIDPAAVPTLHYLPPAVQRMLDTPEGRADVEKWIISKDWGLRLRIMAIKPL